MARAVKWAGRAKSDLRSAVEYIKKQSPASAADFLHQALVADSSAYVNRDNVRTTEDPASGEVDGFVSAYVIERSGDRTLIELPGQPVVGGARTWVPTSFLSEATA